jgi:hypothetical protein
LRHFKRYGCAAWVLKRGSYKDKGILREHSIPCMYVGTGERRGQLGAMFLLPSGQSIVTEHYRVDESRISSMIVRRPPAIAMFVATSLVPTRALEFALVLDAKRREMKNLCNIETFEWHVGELPTGAREVPGSFGTKRNPDGSIKVTKEGLAKSRLCLRGDTTPKGDDVPTYATCISWCAGIIFSALAAAHGAQLRQSDVVNAYVQADLHAHPNKVGCGEPCL